jgi:hypothetical protein
MVVSRLQYSQNCSSFNFVSVQTMLHLSEKYVISNVLSSKTTHLFKMPYNIDCTFPQFHFVKYLIMLPPFQVDRFARLQTHL